MIESPRLQGTGGTSSPPSGQRQIPSIQSQIDYLPQRRVRSGTCYLYGSNTIRLTFWDCAKFLQYMYMYIYFQTERVGQYYFLNEFDWLPYSRMKTQITYEYLVSDLHTGLK